MSKGIEFHDPSDVSVRNARVQERNFCTRPYSYGEYATPSVTSRAKSYGWQSFLRNHKKNLQAILCIFTSMEHITEPQAENTMDHRISLSLDVPTYIQENKSFWRFHLEYLENKGTM